MVLRFFPLTLVFRNLIHYMLWYSYIHVSWACARSLLNFLDVFIIFIKFYKIEAMIYACVFAYLSLFSPLETSYVCIRPLDVLHSSLMPGLYFSLFPVFYFG